MISVLELIRSHRQTCANEGDFCYLHMQIADSDGLWYAAVLPGGAHLR